MKRIAPARLGPWPLVLASMVACSRTASDEPARPGPSSAAAQAVSASPPVDTGMIIWLDPPKHTMLRKLVAKLDS